MTRASRFSGGRVVHLDVDVELDEPSLRRSGAALQALRAGLGIPDDS
ncbi:hypothetical protein OG530_38545 [Streptomyces decoyicus]